jgi:hypothetical protein
MMQAAVGVFVDGFSTTALPAASAGATLCATVFSGALKGVIAHTTPSGTRSVKPRRPPCPAAPSIGTISPAEAARLLGRQAEGLHAALELARTVAGREADLDLQRAHQFVLALLEQRGGAVEDGAALVRGQCAGAKGGVGGGHRTARPGRA